MLGRALRRLRRLLAVLCLLGEGVFVAATYAIPAVHICRQAATASGAVVPVCGPIGPDDVILAVVLALPARSCSGLTFPALRSAASSRSTVNRCRTRRQPQERSPTRRVARAKRRQYFRVIAFPTACPAVSKLAAITARAPFQPRASGTERQRQAALKSPNADPASQVAGPQPMALERLTSLRESCSTNQGVLKPAGTTMRHVGIGGSSPLARPEDDGPSRPTGRRKDSRVSVVTNVDYTVACSMPDLGSRPEERSEMPADEPRKDRRCLKEASHGKRVRRSAYRVQ